MTLSAIPEKIPETKKIVFHFLSITYIRIKPIDQSYTNSISWVPLQISPAHFCNFRPTHKIKGSLHKKQGNKLNDKPGVLQTLSIVSVAMLLNQQEGPPRKYCYQSSKIHSLLLLLGFTTLCNILGHQRRFRHRA